jgi:leucyl/phenylalanyl-tRNA--protein transferase
MAYAQGYFPMAESMGAEHCVWVKPKTRGIIPLDKFHIPHKLGQKFRHMKGEIFCDRDFKQTLFYCQTIREGKSDTWINDEIYDLYLELHEAGHAHSIEYWEDHQLCGGLYGLHLGGAFFGESMFSRVTNASKFCLIQLVATLISNHFMLLDAQFMSAHLGQFGAEELDHESFLPLLEEAASLERKFRYIQKSNSDILKIITNVKSSSI